LTVLRALREALPAEDFIYLGDTARLPYGTKSAATVVRYSMQCAAALLEHGIGSAAPSSTRRCRRTRSNSSIFEG